MKACGEIIGFFQLVCKDFKVSLGRLGEGSCSDEFEFYAVLIVQGFPDGLQFLFEFLVAVLRKRRKVLQPHPCAENLPQGLPVHLARADKLSLNDEHSTFLIIHDDGVNLLVVLAIGDVVPCCDWIAQKNTPQIPSNEPLTVVREVLLIEHIIFHFLLNLLKHWGAPHTDSERQIPRRPRVSIGFVRTPYHIPKVLGAVFTSDSAIVIGPKNCSIGC